MKLLYFRAKWCLHCKTLETNFMARLQNIGNVRIEIIDCDKEKTIFRKYNINAIPTIILATNTGKPLWSYSGDDISQEELESQIERIRKSQES